MGNPGNSGDGRIQQPCNGFPVLETVAERKVNDIRQSLFTGREIAPESWESASLLMEQIVAYYHRSLVGPLRDLWRSVREVIARAPKGQHSELSTLEACLSELQTDLAMQMIKEETLRASR